MGILNSDDRGSGKKSQGSSFLSTERQKFEIARKGLISSRVCPFSGLVFVQAAEFTYETRVWVFARDGWTFWNECVLAEEAKAYEGRDGERELEEGFPRGHMGDIGTPHRKHLVVFVNGVTKVAPLLGVPPAAGWEALVGDPWQLWIVCELGVLFVGLGCDGPR